jgi:tetratricopeptide (TPR) repeat protein
MRTHRFALLGLLLVAAPSWAQEPPELKAEQTQPPAEVTEMARRFYASGEEAYVKGDFPTALRAFEAAWGTLPQPEFQFNIARCHERMGHFAAAASAYQQYLASKPGAADADEVRMRVAELQMREREAEAARVALRPAPTLPPRQRSLRVPALALLGVAIALGGAGTGAYLSEWSEYQSRKSACLSACDPASLDGLRTRVEVAQVAGGVLWGLAGAALIADVALWIADARARRERPPSTAARAPGWSF